MARLTLQKRLDFAGATELKETILANAGQDLELDASAVTHMGTLCLQVLLSASSDWRKTGLSFHISDPSDICITQLALHGFTPATLTGEPK